MNFEYQATISEPQEGGDYLLILRPEIPITIIGAKGTSQHYALVDTGADETILPREIATELGISLVDHGGHATTFGGSQVRLEVGEARFQLESEGETLEWTAIVSFFDTPEGQTPTLILGHAGFLDDFTATFDGRNTRLTLVANEDLPSGS